MALAPSANASVAYAISLEELVLQSRHALVGTPRDASAQWEYVGNSRRIVTYTRVVVEELLNDRAPADAEIMVRTLGGRVGDIAQAVPGEAELVSGKTSSLFLARASTVDALFVTAMSQGHFPMRADARGVMRLQPSPRLPDLKNAERSAARLLGGRSVADVRELVHKALQK